MIKVNLLKSFGAASVESIQIAEEQNSSNLNFAKNIIVMLLGIGALFVHEMFNIPDLNSQLQVVRNEIAEATRFNQKMNSMKKEIEKYEKDLKRLNSQTEFLQKVQKERQLSVDLISKMKYNIPDKVWLNSLSAMGNTIDIKGDAESNADVNEFNNRLASAPYLKDVVIVSSLLKPNSKASIQTFIIKASYVDIKNLLNNGMPENGPEVAIPPEATPPAANKGDTQ